MVLMCWGDMQQIRGCMFGDSETFRFFSVSNCFSTLFNIFNLAMNILLMYEFTAPCGDVPEFKWLGLLLSLTSCNSKLHCISEHNTEKYRLLIKWSLLNSAPWCISTKPWWTSILENNWSMDIYRNERHLQSAQLYIYGVQYTVHSLWLHFCVIRCQKVVINDGTTLYQKLALNADLGSLNMVWIINKWRKSPKTWINTDNAYYLVLMPTPFHIHFLNRQATNRTNLTHSIGHTHIVQKRSGHGMKNNMVLGCGPSEERTNILRHASCNTELDFTCERQTVGLLITDWHC